MDIRIEKTLFVSALAAAKAVADHRSPMLPILAHVLLRTQGKYRLTCAATDLNISYVAALPADVRQDGAVALASKPLHDIVKGLPDGEVHLSTAANGWAVIRAGKAEFKLAGLQPADFPKLPLPDGAEFGKVEADLLRNLIAKTAFACSTDETRPHLSGALLQTPDGIARMVATDGHRLAKVERAWNGGPPLTAGIVIPRKGLHQIERLLDGVDGTCDMAVNDGTLFVRAAGATLAVKLADVQFPPWEQVIPKEQERQVVVNRQALRQALERVSLMASDRTLGVQFDLREGRLRLSAENAELGEGHEEIEVAYDAQPLRVAFNARYVAELLDAITSEDVRLGLDGEIDPALLRPLAVEEYLGVVMPMRM